MDYASSNGIVYRNGEWGPAYLITGPSSDFGVLRLRPGDEMVNHIHEHCDESFYVLEGTATLWIGCEDERTLTVGDAYRCGPGEMHYFVNNSDAPFRCLFIKSPQSPGDTIALPWRPGEPKPPSPGSGQ